MALVQRTINQCDVCGYEWIPRSNGERCGNRECRSTKWNGSVPYENVPKAKPVEAKPMSMAGAMDKLMQDTRPIVVETAEQVMCSYREYDGDTGRTIACGLPQHGGKIKHSNWKEVL